MAIGDEYDLPDPLSDFEPESYEDPLEQAIAEEKVSAITVRPFTSLSPDTCVKKAIELLSELEVACAMIEQNGQLVGMFSEWDVLHRVVCDVGDLAQVRVSEVMTRDPVFVYEADSVASVLGVIALCGYRHVPVLDVNGRIVGVVSPRRLAEFLQTHVEQSTTS